MKEVERIIQKGVIPEDFLKEEVRNDYLVTTQRKRIWTVLLDLGLEFDRVCKKHGIRYFFSDGNLIGAIRHHGFIPWDDDLDVMMPREDYERFLQLGNEFKDPYFFQTPYTDKGCYFAITKIRNSRTTGLIDRFKYQGFNQGIWLSVFPLDTVDPEKGAEIYKQINALNVENSTYMRMSHPNLDEKDRERVKNYSGRDPLKTYEEIHCLARRFEGEDTGYCAVMVSTADKYSKKVFKKEWFSESVLCPVEGFEFSIPKHYDEILMQYYGDYMQLPPVNERGIKHDGVLWDPDKPYTEYLPKK